MFSSDDVSSLKPSSTTETTTRSSSALLRLRVNPGRAKISCAALPMPHHAASSAASSADLFSTVPSWMVFQIGTAVADRIGLGCNAGELAFANKCRRKTSPAEQGGASLTSAEPATENCSGAIGGLMNSEDRSSA